MRTVLSMLGRFLVYGFLGWGVEALFTGLHSVFVGRDRSATAKTYLWMHPIYGGAGLLLEAVGRGLHRFPAARPLAYVPIIYAVEYGAGYALRKALGRCPWDYGPNGVNVHGLIRLDYAPAWLAAAYLFEPLAARVRRALEPMAHAVIDKVAEKVEAKVEAKVAEKVLEPVSGKVAAA